MKKELAARPTLFMEITGLEPAAYALRTHRYPSLAISPCKLIVAH